MLSVSETSTWKNFERVGGREVTREVPASWEMSRIEMLAPADIRFVMVARPRPEALLLSVYG
jgi:hypothetical protein